MANEFDFHQITEAYARIRDYIHYTPVLTSSVIDNMVGSKIYFKAECLQETGSFKARGALNAVLKLKSDKKVDHVTTASLGNHGAGVAYAGQIAGMKSTIVLPKIPTAKTALVSGYGANIIYCEPGLKYGLAMCQKIVENEGAVFIDPANYDIFAGQGTIAMEFLDQVPQLDAILVPVGHGTAAAGIATWVKHVKPGCKIFAVEVEGKNLAQSFLSGKQSSDHQLQVLKTIADGICLPSVSKNSFPIMCSLMEKDVFTVNDEEIISAMKLVFQRLKVVIEPTAATAVAALFGETFRSLQPNLKNVGVVLTGGNIELDDLPWNKK